MSNINISQYICKDIEEFVKNISENQELEITIYSEKIPIKNYLDEISYSYISKNKMSICQICNSGTENKMIREIKMCNHQFHKKCFDKLFKKKINYSNVVDEKTNLCPICNL